MGMDLVTRNRTDGDLSYNWAGWRWLREHLAQWGVNTSEFSGTNDGDYIKC